MIEVMTSYTWPTAEIPFASLGVRVDDLAARLGVAVHAWTVDGLGPAKGFGFRLPSGCVYLLEELELEVHYRGAQGPNVHVDAADLSRCGSKALVDEVVAGLGLSRLEVVYVADSAVQEAAANLVAKVAAARAKGER
jgi:hypothetical protein